MTKCGKGCPACHYVEEGNSVKINKKKWKFFNHMIIHIMWFMQLFARNINVRNLI